jgi:Lon protease-like protein
MASDPVIPLFPLSIVVFPGHMVPLHIFEERYKKMIEDCAQDEADSYQPFGISYENDGDVAQIGCAVTVTRITERYDDGSFDVMCRARSRYRTVEVLGEQPYMTGRVEYFGDDDGDVDPALQELVKQRFRSLVDLAAEEAGAHIVDGEGTQEEAAKGLEEGDAFAVAQRMGLEPARKQRLLEMTTENARLQHLAAYLEELLPVLEERMERKRRVKSNGRTHEV